MCWGTIVIITRTSALYKKFMAKVEKTTTCWIFRSAPNNAGYGSLCITKKIGTKMAHRVSWELFNGPIPNGLCVCHTCDNRICVNPEHLFLGTHKDNTHDAIQKGRWSDPPTAKGIDAHNAKLSFTDVQQIQELYRHGYGTQKEIGVLFGVGRSTVSNIICGIHWGCRV